MPAGEADVKLDHDACGRATRLGAGVLLCAAFAALAYPTLAMIARESWVDEQAQHGPLILAIGLWLVWRRWGEAEAAAQPPPNPVTAVAAFVLGAVAYVLSRIASQYIGESYALCLIGFSILYARLGGRGCKPLYFPLGFLLFAVPVPFAVGWPVTVTLRLAISHAAVEVMQAFGVAAVSDGLTMYVGSYRIEIAQACSGMNSLITLSALGLVYVYLRREPGMRAYALMAPGIVAFAVIANFVRVLAVVALTQLFGDAVAQGASHTAMGLMTFAVALIGVFALDAMLAARSFGRSAREERA